MAANVGSQYCIDIPKSDSDKNVPTCRFECQTSGAWPDANKIALLSIDGAYVVTNQTSEPTGL